MIVGSGSIAKLLNDREGFLFFAKGASNSKRVDTVDLLRESMEVGHKLRIARDEDLMFVYFSTISIFTHKTSYTEHKQVIEDVIKRTADNYVIIRIGNVWECTNPKTFINAYKKKPYVPRDEYKYMISKEQLQLITDGLPQTGKHVICAFGEMLKVKECLM